MRLCLVLTALLASGVAVAADTIKFEPRVGVPTFAVRAPVLRIKPGDVVECAIEGIATLRTYII